MIKVSPSPIPELKAFLMPFRRHFHRAESIHVLERYAAGLLTDLEYKSGAAVAQAVAGLSESALYRLLGQSVWDAKAVDRQRVETMLQPAVVGDGVIVVDDT